MLSEERTQPGDRSDHLRTVAVIPARGGSKGVPKKNLKRIQGRSLVERAIDASGAAIGLTNVYVSTDDDEIAAVSLSAGASVIQRPAAISGDSASSESALLHSIQQIEAATGSIDIVVFAQCTSPFIDPVSISNAVKRVAGGVDVVFSAVESHVFLWSGGNDGSLIGLNHDHRYRLRRQDRPPEYAETGAFYVMRAAGFVSAQHRFFGRIEAELVNPADALEVDEPSDLELAKHVAGARQPAASPPSANIDLLVTDFDGVHTDDRVLVLEDGTEGVVASRSDGFGIELLRRHGIPTLILSKEINPVVRARAAKLGVECLSGVEDKWPVLKARLVNSGIEPSRVAYIGNDLNDLECLEKVGLAMCVADAHPALEDACQIKLRRAGGQGAVREAADLLLKHADRTGDHTRVTYR